MDFDFSSQDDTAFSDAKDGFLEDLNAWFEQRSGQAFPVQHVDLFLAWNFEHRRLPLRTLSRADIEDYLLEFLPERSLARPDDAGTICRSLEAMIEFLSLIEQLDNGFERAASLIAFIADIEPDVVDALGDETKGGMGRSILGAQLSGADGAPLPDLDRLLDSGDLSIEEMQDLLNERMEAFNSLPFDERKRLTDAPMRREPTPLGFTFIPPSPDEVEASALASEVLQMVDRFVTVARDEGIALTGAGNIKPADARTLTERLDSGDDVTGMRSSLDLRWLTLIDDLTSAVGAVDRMRTVIRADSEWFDRTATERATMLCDTILESGFLASKEMVEDARFELRQLIDDGVPHWFGPALAEGTAVDVDAVMELAVEVAAGHPNSLRTGVGAEVFDDWVMSLVSELFSGLERFGLMTWTDAQVRIERALGTSMQVGGEIALTALGRAVLPRHVEAAGYTFDTLADIAEATPAQLIELARATGLDGEQVLGRWRPDDSIRDRAQALGDHVRTGGSIDRLVVFDYFKAVPDPTSIEPVVRQLLDSSAASQAASFLLEHGMATSDDVGGFVDLTPLVDMMFMVSDAPEEIDKMFRWAVDAIDGDVIEELWRHDQPETIIVLEAAGRHVTDRTLAKRIRTAANKHRSWLANQGR